MFKKSSKVKDKVIIAKRDNFHKLLFPKTNNSIMFRLYIIEVFFKRYK